MAIIRRLPSAVGTEVVPLEACRGRVLAQPLAWDRDHPPFDRVAMDGFAIDRAPCDGMTLECVGEAAAGSPWPGQLREGQCVAVATGAVLPLGGAWVVPIEQCRVEGTRVTLVHPGERRNIHERGSDASAGSTALDAPRLLNPGALALLAAVGTAQVAVRERLKMAVLATGSELVPPDRTPEPHQIRATHLELFRGVLDGVPWIRLLGADLALDHAADIDTWLDERGADLLITTGGVGRSTHDLIPGCLTRRGFRILFHGLALKPGHPVLLAQRGSQVALGLPGNPVSVLACWALLGWNLARVLTGQPIEEPETTRSTQPLSAPGRRDLLQPWSTREDGPVTWNGSGDLGALARLDSFALVPRDSHQVAGPHPLFRVQP